MTLKEHGKQYSAIHNYVSAIIAFYKINDIVLNVTKISKFDKTRKWKDLVIDSAPNAEIYA